MVQAQQHQYQYQLRTCWKCKFLVLKDQVQQVWVGGGGICISNKFLGDADAEGDHT